MSTHAMAAEVLFLVACLICTVVGYVWSFGRDTPLLDLPTCKNVILLSIAASTTSTTSTTSFDTTNIRCERCGPCLVVRHNGTTVTVEPCAKCEDDTENRASEREY